MAIFSPLGSSAFFPTPFASEITGEVIAILSSLILPPKMKPATWQQMHTP